MWLHPTPPLRVDPPPRGEGKKERRSFLDSNIGLSEYWIARWSLSSGAHSRDPVAGDDGEECSASVFIKHTFAFPRRVAPELCLNVPPKEGAGNAGCPMHPQPRV